ATGGYDDGTSADLTSQAVWASGAPGVATINGTALATGLTGGQSAISATVGAIGGSTTLAVVEPPPPTVSCHLTRPMLWPPDHDLIDVGLALQASSSATRLTLKVYSDEPEESQTGDGKFSPDARQFGPIAAGPIPLLLRAERKGNGDSRVYLIVVTATD